MKWIKASEKLPTKEQIDNGEIIFRTIKCKSLLALNGVVERIENNKIIISTHWYGDIEYYTIDKYEWLDEENE